MSDGIDDGAPVARVVRVVPDVIGIDKEFDYTVAEGVDVHVGDVVRLDLHGRRVGGWILAVDVEPVLGVSLRPLAKVSGRGPGPELIELAGWAAWRWAGRRPHLLRTASPPGVVRNLTGSNTSSRSPGRRPPAVAGSGGATPDDEPPWLARALARERAVLRLPPGADRYALVRAAVGATTGDRGPNEPTPSVAEGVTVDAAPRRDHAGQTLVLCPSVAEARSLGRRLRAKGVATAIVANDLPPSAAAGEWADAASGAAQVVVGARAAAWAPAPDLSRVVVLDEHDEAYQQEQAPTWHARDVVAERARRAEVPCLLVSPCPSLEALAWGDLVEVDRPEERAGWPRLEVVDQRDLDPALGPLFSPRLVDVVRGEGRVLCVLNRTGRVRLLACGACRTLARCERCEAAVSREDPEGAPAELVCGRCNARRPVVCTACGATGFKNLRLGVSKAREELEVLAGEAVVEVTAASALDDPVIASARILIGTEAVLHRVTRADAVAFLDFDQELLALRWRAAEQALGLLARAARLVRRGGGRDGRLLVQTRTPDHPVLMAARHADPGRLVESEVPLRRTLGLPPSTAMALVSGQAAEAFMAAFGSPEGVVVQGPLAGTWRLRGRDHQVLCGALAATERPPRTPAHRGRPPGGVSVRRVPGPAAPRAGPGRPGGQASGQPWRRAS